MKTTREVLFTVRVAYVPELMEEHGKAHVQVIADEIQSNLESVPGVVAVDVRRQEVE